MNEQIEQNPIPLEPQEQSKLGKHFVFLITLLVISLASAGLVFAVNYISKDIENQKVEVSVPVSDSYEDWKTYRNEEYGFEFKYPADFSVVKERSTPPEVVSLQKRVVFESEKLETIDVFITEGEGSISGPYLKGSGNVTVEEVFVGNKIGQRILGTVDQGSAGHLIFIPLSNAELGMSFTVRHVDNFTGSIANDWLLVESILSTFKFSDKTSTDTSDWKTYRNKEYSFEFKYPSKLGNSVKAPEFKLDCTSTAYRQIPLAVIANLTIGLACEQTITPFLDDTILIDTADGGVGYLHEYISSTGYINKDAYIEVKGIVYILLTHTFKLGNPEYVELSSDDFKEILSTFKFTM